MSTISPSDAPPFRRPCVKGLNPASMYYDTAYDAAIDAYLRGHRWWWQKKSAQREFWRARTRREGIKRIGLGPALDETSEQDFLDRERTPEHLDVLSLIARSCPERHELHRCVAAYLEGRVNLLVLRKYYPLLRSILQGVADV